MKCYLTNHFNFMTNFSTIADMLNFKVNMMVAVTFSLLFRNLHELEFLLDPLLSLVRGVFLFLSDSFKPRTDPFNVYLSICIYIFR